MYVLKCTITMNVLFYMFVSISWKSHKFFFDNVIMLRFGETKIEREKFYAGKKPVNICDVNIVNKVISKLIETKINSKYLTGYSDKVIRTLVLILRKMSGYVKTFKFKNKSNNLMSFRINDGKLLQKYRPVWTKIEDLKHIELNALPVYDDKYIKTKLRTYGDRFSTNFRGLNVPEDDIERETFADLSVDSCMRKQILP